MNTTHINNPISDDEVAGLTSCGCAGCDVKIRQSNAINGCINIGASTRQEHFCSFECRNTWRDYMRPGVQYREF